MKKLLSLLIFGFALFCSCNEPLGLWETMKWKTNIPHLKKDHIIEVPSVGGTYTLKCKNYESFWIEYVNGINKYVDNGEELTEDWYTICLEKNVVTVIIASNESPDDRTLDIGIRGGNATDGFTFEQNKGKVFDSHKKEER